MTGQRARYDTCTNLMKLTELEEDVVLRNVLDKIDRGFAPWIVDVGDMANILLAERGV